MENEIKVGDKVLISPEVTNKERWVSGVVIDVHNNPFIGIVISAQTEDGNVFFNRAELFKPVESLCMQ